MPKKGQPASPEAQARWRDYARQGCMGMAAINIDSSALHTKASGAERDELKQMAARLRQLQHTFNMRMKPDAQD